MEYRYTPPLTRIISLENVCPPPKKKSKINDMNYIHSAHQKTTKHIKQNVYYRFGSDTMRLYESPLTHRFSIVQESQGLMVSLKNK